MKGTVTKEGEITGRLVHIKAPVAWGNQDRVGMLSADGKTIAGRAKFDRLYGKGSTPADVKDVILKATERCAPSGFGR